VNGPRVALGNKQARGGVIGGKGYSFQAAYIVSRIPRWLEDVDFAEFLQEGAGDVDVLFRRTDGEERWYIQVKSHAVTPAKARDVFAQFAKIDEGSPDTYRRFILACPGLSEDLSQLRAAVQEWRGMARFFRRGEDKIIDNTWADLENLVQTLKLPVSADFLVDKVSFDTDLAGLTDDTSLRRLFVGTLVESSVRGEWRGESLGRAYQKLALICHSYIRKTYSREHIERIIQESAGEELYGSEYDDLVARIEAIVNDLDQLTVETAVHLAVPILKELNLPTERAWEHCRSMLQNRNNIDVLRFRARIEYYLKSKYAVGTLQELVGLHGSSPQVLYEAGSMRFELAEETAKYLYNEEKPHAQLKLAEEHLKPLYKTRGDPQPSKGKRLAQSALRSRYELSYEDYLEREIILALQWVTLAHNLDADDLSFHKATVDMWKELICSKLRRGIIQINRTALLDRIRQRFSESDLRDMCFELDVDYDNLLGSNKQDKARELIQELMQQDRMCELMELCSRLRPDVSWCTYPRTPIGRIHSLKYLRKNIATIEESDICHPTAF